MKFVVMAAAWLLAAPVHAQVDALSDAALGILTKAADETAAIEVPPVPKMLLLATIAATDPKHLDRAAHQSQLTLQLARLHLVGTSATTFERKAFETALAELLGARLTPRQIAEVYAATVYYGRNCYGFVDAAGGLARTSPSRATDGVWLGLAALPRSPTLYLGSRVALKARVADIIEVLRVAGLVNEAEAERLSALPLANIDSGNGCSSN